ncbi:MAG: 1-acyl-sn-glycerol-3-phosphate acyltransferase [Anaerolineales bacterium]|nr:1-acyl-sn-glycerol-3-phosphate acyltransferase [Anaerolineales bacterium]
MFEPKTEFRYPRRRTIRFIAHMISVPLFGLLTRLEVKGGENLPQKGPFMVVGNHFSFIDPAALVRIAQWPMEFVGGAEFPHAPGLVKFIPNIWGYYPLYRGTGSRYALKAAEAILAQNGILGIFPEAGSWAEILRPARPGTAYLAARTGAPILPVGLSGFNDVIPLRLGKRANVKINIGKLIGPFSVTGKGRERRTQLDEIGAEIMKTIADLLPPHLRGFYSDDPLVREAAKGAEIYPWADKIEGDVEGEIH